MKPTPGSINDYKMPVTRKISFINFFFFVKKRTMETELIYKLYKNKLVNILRKTKKDYYNNLLTRPIQKVLEGNTKKSEYPKYFTNQLKTITKPIHIANEFNHFLY